MDSTVYAPTHASTVYAAPVPRIVFGVTVPMTAQAFLRDQMQALAELGWDVHLVTSREDGSDSFDRLQDLGCVTFHVIPMVRPPNPGRDFMALRAWIRLLRRLAPDVVVASTPKAGLLGMLAARRTNVPIRVYHVRGLRAEGLTGPMARISWASESLAVRSATDVLCDSRSVLDQLSSRGLIGTQRATILGLGSCTGVDTQWFRPPTHEERTAARDAFGFDEGDIVFGFVGRLAVDKGVRELTGAFSDVTNHVTGARLALVGPLEAPQALGAVLERVETSDRMAWYGRTADPRAAYWAFDAFVLPSYREGFPIAPLEAQACGLPVLTTTATGCIDAIVDGETGYAVEPRSAHALVAPMVTLAGNSVLRRTMGNAAHQWVSVNFEQGQVRRRFIEWLTSLTSHGQTKA